jgi:hypothetical protein
MYTRAYDKDRHLLVTLFSGRSNTYQDFQRAAADAVAADGDAEGSADGVVHIAEITPGCPPPDPRCRKLLQDAVQSATRAPRYVACFITSSSLARGVLTTLRWFQPSNAPQVPRAFARFEEAVAFAETHRPGVAARLLELRSEAFALAEQAPGGAQR